MEKYLGVKLIEAEPMTLGAYNTYRGWKIPENEDPSAEGMLVKYSDDYVSWSPMKQFVEAYRLISGLTFGLAVEAMKLGHAVARAGWNGKGMYLYLVPAASYKASTEIAREEFGEVVPYGAYIAMKTAQGNVVPWLASQTDVLGEDYFIVQGK